MAATVVACDRARCLYGQMTHCAEIPVSAGPSATTNTGPLMFQPEVLELLGGISPDTLGRWWRGNLFPRPLAWPGRRLCWSRAAVTRWLETQCGESQQVEEATKGACPG
jgi:predicted DNA-binding transcriptional regulator AlpA